MQVFIPIEHVPTTTHQQKKVSVVKGKPVYYEPASLKKARAILSSHLANHVPEKPYTKPVACTVKWFYARAVTKVEWRKQRPDTHNLNKLLFDVMTDLGYWEDDSLVVSEVIQKFNVPRGDEENPPGIFISIEEV